MDLVYRQVAAIAFYSDRSRNYEIWTIGLEGGVLRRLNNRAPNNCYYPTWSPAGQKLTGVWQSEKASGVFTYSLATRRYERIADFGSDPIWLSDNRRLLFIFRHKLYLVDIRAKQAREILSPDPLRISLAAPSRDNRQIYLSLISPESDIQMLSLR